MKKNCLKLGAMLCIMTMLLQTVIIPVGAYNVGEFVSSPPNNWIKIADSSITDSTEGGWEKHGNSVTQSGSQYSLSGDARIETAANSTTGYTDTLVLTTKTSMLAVAPFKEAIGSEASAITHTISFASGADDATGTVPESLYKKAGETITLPQNTFTKTGYTFKCWNDGTSDYLSGASYTMPDNDVTFTAVWEEKQNASTGTYVDESTSTLHIDLSGYDVTYSIRTVLAFYTNNAEDIAPSAPSDVVIFEQAETTIEDSYNFTPIAEPKDYMVVIYEGRAGQQLREVIELTHVTHWYSDWNKDETGHWKECANASCDYSISYGQHGDFEDGAADCTANTQCGICGYVIGGTSNQEHLYSDFLDADCNRNGCLHTRVASAVDITFDVNGGIALTETTTTTGADGKLTNDLPQPTRNGWSFNGWYTAASGGTKINKATAVFYDDATIYAQWTSVYQTGGSGGASIPAVTYTVHFETNGGTEINDISRKKGVEINFDGFVPEKENYKFAGWYSDPELQNEVKKIILTSDITVYAKWEKSDLDDEIGKIDEKSVFEDVSKNDWFYESVVYVQENGLMNGISNTQFNPYGTATRAMVTTVLYRMAGEPEVTDECSFNDIDSNTYYYNAVRWAAANGIVRGISETTFQPLADMTREQFVTVLYRYANPEANSYDNVETYSDFNDVSEYAKAAFGWACDKGVITGYDNMLMPKNTVSRSEIAAMLMRFGKITK